MEKTFLKIARVSLIFVIAGSLLVTVAAIIYGGFQFVPSHPKTPEISVTYNPGNPDQATAVAENNAVPSAGPDATSAAHFRVRCGLLAAKLDQVNAAVGWDKNTTNQLNPATMLYEPQTTVDYTSTINEDKFCALTRRTIEEQNERLAPYFKNIDLTNSYLTNLNAYFDALLAHAEQQKALQPNDPNRQYGRTAFESFNAQFAKSVDAARDDAIDAEGRNAAAKAQGLAAFYVAGSAFVFFFSCCLILVFIRIEVNTRELAGIAQTLAQRSPNEPRELDVS